MKLKYSSLKLVLIPYVTLLLSVYSDLGASAVSSTSESAEVIPRQQSTDFASIHLLTPNPGQKFQVEDDVEFKFKILSLDDYKLPKGSLLRLMILNIDKAEMVLDYIHSSSLDTIQVTALPAGRYVATLVVTSGNGSILETVPRTTCPFEVVPAHQQVDEVLQEAMKNCKGVECLVLSSLTNSAKGSSGIVVEKRDFTGEEVKRTDLPQREWMLPKISTSDFVQCKVEIAQHKELLTMPATATISDLTERIRSIHSKQNNSNELAGLQDNEGYFLQEGDQLLGLADNRRTVYVKAVFE